MDTTQLRESGDLPPAAVHFSASGIGKRYPAVQALNGVTFSGSAGEVIAICGANGAGKSTFARILAGVERPTAGELDLGSGPVVFRSPNDAEEAGVLLMHQEPLIIDDLSVGENLWIRSLRRSGLTRPKRGKDEISKRALEAVGLGDISVTRPAWSLSPGQRQMLALARAYIIDHKILILDETTASTTASYFESVIRFIEAERQDGKCVVIVSHKLDEIFAVASRIVVLRDGVMVGDLAASESSPSHVSELMAGKAVRSVRNTAAQLRETTGEHESVLTATNVVSGGARGVSLSVPAGEVLGIYGLVGSGRSSFARAITGQVKLESGSLSVRGRDVKLANPGKALAHGISYISEDRKREGFVPDFSNSHNLSLSKLSDVSVAGFLQKKKERQQAEQAVVDYAIKGGPGIHTATLSGGNQQKVCVASRIAGGREVLVFDEPTKGVDIAAKQNIYQIILDQAAGGKAVIVVSSEEEEILAVASRIVVFRGGRIVAEFADAGETNRADLVHAALGNEK